MLMIFLIVSLVPTEYGLRARCIVPQCSLSYYFWVMPSHVHLKRTQPTHVSFFMFYICCSSFMAACLIINNNGL